MTPEPSRLGQLGNYELLEVLGSGTGGKVYKARCVADNVPGVKFGEIVALKKLWNQGQDLESHHFHRERESLRKLDHPNIVRYKDSFVEADGMTYCLVMEYLDGETLKERIAP
jgi:serine/threonine protein kinase